MGLPSSNGAKNIKAASCSTFNA
ncbi:hypothetical protein FA549_30775 [Pseudomonas aeruginosa]|nr:hypothetical protein [Pseudomonas aeruginosa]